MASRRSIIQAVQSTDAAVRDGDDEALQFEPVANARRRGAGWTRGWGQDGKGEQPRAMERFTRTLRCSAHFLREPALLPPLLCEEEEPAPG